VQFLLQQSLEIRQEFPLVLQLPPSTLAGWQNEDSQTPEQHAFDVVQ
jgi:hypothetical protein